VESTREVDASASKEFLDTVETITRDYEKKYIASMVELMEIYEKPVIGVSLAKTEEGTIRLVEGRRYSGVFYQTPENAVNVLAGMVDYWRSTDAP